MEIDAGSSASLSEDATFSFSAAMSHRSAMKDIQINAYSVGVASSLRFDALQKLNSAMIYVL